MMCPKIGIRLAAAAFCCLLSAAGSSGAGLIGLYTFDDPSNLGKDSSGQNHNATNGGATYAAGGYLGGAASFNSSSFISVPIDVSTQALPQLTWGAWVKPTSATPIEAILSSDNGGFDRDIDLDFRGGSTSYSAFTGSGVLGSGTAPSTTAFTFVAAVYDQSAKTMTLYVDGASFTTATNFDGDALANFQIGANPGFGENFNGLIDNVFVYNQALTSAQIAGIRASGFGPAVPEPSSIALCGIAGVVGLGYARARRRATIA